MANKRPNNRKRKHRYKVPYIFNDEGKKTKRYVHVPRGCRFLRRVEVYHGNFPKTIRGKEVISWVNVYSADDQVADRFSPIIRLRSNYPKKRKTFLDRLFHKLFS